MQRTTKILNATRRVWIGAVGAAVAVLLLASHSAHSDGGRVYALVNAKNPTKSIQTAQVKGYFMGSTSFWNGVVPVRLYSRPETAVGSFFGGVLGTTAQHFAQHWTTRQLSGLGTSPEVVEDVNQLCNRVRAAPGALSVLNEHEVEAARSQPGVKVLAVE